MADNNKLSAEITLRVEGGGDLNGATGKGILNDISSILRSIEKNEASKLKIGIDEAYLRSQIQSVVRSAVGSASASYGSSGSNATRQSTGISASEIASLNAAKISATRYFDSHESRIKSNTELMQMYNRFMSEDFKSSADARASLSAWKRACVEAGVETKSLGENVKGLWNKFGGAIASRLVVDGLSRAIRQSIQTVQELDKAVVNLSMVTGYSRTKTKELLETYVEMGKTLGATTTDVANSANEWLRQGYSIEETNKLIESSVILSKVGMLESAEATKYLTSALKGYKVDISDAMTIVDKMTSVDMKAAVSTAGLAEAMSKTANSARLAGVDMDRLLGYIAAVGEVTQADPASVGTSFKTLFSRLSNIKLGRLEDENGEDITQSLNDAETVLNRVNIRLRDTATSYRDFGDVFDEIAAKWSSFNDIERNTIAMAFGGTRQKEQILTLFENYQNAMNYAETATNSAGTAMQKYDAYVSGLEKSIKSFQASWESLVNHLIDSDFIKGAVDLGTNIVNILDGLTKIKMLLPTIISLVLTAKNVGERMIENAGLCTLRKCA